MALLRDLRESDQDFVAGLMAVGVVDALEEIQVQHCEAEFGAAAVGAAFFLLQHVREVEAIAPAGEFVTVEQSFDRLFALLQSVS